MSRCVRFGRYRRVAAAVAAAVGGGAAARAQAQTPVTTCDDAGIGAVALEADGPPLL